MKSVKLEGTAFLNNPCVRCNDGSHLECSEPCMKYRKTGHDHFCPDCGRERKIYPEIIVNDK